MTDPTSPLDLTTVVVDTVKNTPFAGVVLYGLYKAFEYIKDLIAKLEAKDQAHIAEMKAIHEKHDAKQEASQALYVEMTRSTVGAIAEVKSTLVTVSDRLCDTIVRVDKLADEVKSPARPGGKTAKSTTTA